MKLLGQLWIFSIKLKLAIGTDAYVGTVHFSVEYAVEGFLYRI
jgi:hypothetical protein